MTPNQAIIAITHCPTCRARAGQKCRSTVSRRLIRIEPHDTRIDAYRRIAARKTGRRKP